MQIGSKPLSVLIVSGTEKGKDFIKALIPRGGGYGESTAVSSSDEAKRLLLSQSYDLVLINTPLTDSFGSELALKVNEEGGSCAMLLVKGEQYEMTADKVEEYGVVTVTKPLSRQSFSQSLGLLAATRRRLIRVEKENERLKAKAEEVRVVSRAKWALIENEGLTESEAHRKIEKLAMDLRLSRRSVADEIITKYQN